jgi:hypothetical protein
MAADKDTVYIDIDDEITGIIDKLKASDNKVVALVLPKRAAVFQSIVNMKLLKRAAESSKKNVVLITSEAGLLPLAGAAGIHVAKTLTSKPEIPAGPQEFEDTDEAIDEDSGLAEAAASGTAASAAKSKPASDGVETLVLDDEDLPPEADASSNGPKTFEPPAKAKGKKNKKLAVPNFERFRLWLILGGVALILLIAGLIFANIALPKAVISIKTNASSVDVGFGLNLSTTAKKLNEQDGTIPAKLVSQQKVFTQQVPTTGQKNNGNKASGTITLTNCSKQDGDINLPAGSSFSSGGNTFVTQESVTIPESSFNNSGTKCTSSPSVSVDILAQNAGTAYNDAVSFTAGSPYGGVTGKGSTSGGTDNIVQSVNQNDITTARNKITANDAEVKKALEADLKKNGQYAILATFVAGEPAINTSAKVGEVANNVTVTLTTNYTMFGVLRDDLETLVVNDINQQIDEEQQTVLDDGLAKAIFNVDNISPTGAQLSLSAIATAGPDLDVDTIKKNAVGKKAGAIKDDLGNNPDVTGVEVKLSPFWVSTVPKKLDRIKVEIAKPSATPKASTSNDDNP